MSTVTVAATQMACGWDRDVNMACAEKLIREAAGRGANVVLIQELFETPYFCKDHSPRHFELARPLEGQGPEPRKPKTRFFGLVLRLSCFGFERFWCNPGEIVQFPSRFVGPVFDYVLPRRICLEPIRSE